MKKIAALALAITALVSTYIPATSAHAAVRTDRRGTVVATGHVVKAVTAGPALVHGYSDIAGGTLFLARAVTGTDADCSAALANHDAGVRTPLVADRVAQVSVGAGQIACLVTDTHRSFELLWHAFSTGTSATVVASSR